MRSEASYHPNPAPQALRQLAQLAALGQVHFEPAGKSRALSWQVLRYPTARAGPASSADGVALHRLAGEVHARLHAQMVASAARLDFAWALLAGAFAAGWHTGLQSMPCFTPTLMTGSRCAACAVCAGHTNQQQEAFLRPAIKRYFAPSAASPHGQQPSTSAGHAAVGAVRPPTWPQPPLAPTSPALSLEVEAFLLGSKARSASAVRQRMWAGRCAPASAPLLSRLATLRIHCAVH